MSTNEKETIMDKTIPEGLTIHEGLTTEEVEFATIILAGLLPEAEVEAGETEDGAKYVVAMEDRDGELTTRTVCREEGRLAVLDTEGRVVT